MLVGRGVGGERDEEDAEEVIGEIAVAREEKGGGEAAAGAGVDAAAELDLEADAAVLERAGRGEDDRARGGRAEPQHVAVADADRPGLDERAVVEARDARLEMGLLRADDVEVGVEAGVVDPRAEARARCRRPHEQHARPQRRRGAAEGEVEDHRRRCQGRRPATCGGGAEAGGRRGDAHARRLPRTARPGLGCFPGPVFE